MARLFFGIDSDGNLVWYDGSSVAAVRQIEETDLDYSKHTDDFELTHVDGTKRMLMDVAVVQTTGEIQKVLGLYDRANRMEDYLKEV